MPETNPPQEPMILRTPIVRIVSDGQRAVLQVMGATNTPPGANDGRYIGPNGYVDNIADAADIRGPAGGSSTGAQGPMGSPGIDGKSAYQLWLDAGNSGSMSAFLASLIGPKGDTGSQGPVGATGAAGPQGVQGIKGDTGATGAAGPSGTTLVGTVTLAESVLITLALGVRRVTTALSGTVTTASFIAVPVAAPPAGYSVQDAFCGTNGQITVGILVPVLGVASSYSIPVRVYRLG